MSNKTLSIIIINFRSETYLEKCLASIYDKIGDRIDFEIRIVNNDNTEKLKLISELYPQAKIINQEKNSGFGSGNNQGARCAQGDFILFLNPDTEIISENIQEVFLQFLNNPKLSILGGRLITTSGETQEWSAGTEINLWKLVKNNLKISKDQEIWENKISRYVDWVAGTALFIKRKDFIDIGGFDENFFMYFEDMDLCRKARSLGQKVLYYPEFSVKHWGGGSFSSASKQKRNYYESQEYFFKKHKGAPQYLAIKILRLIWQIKQSFF